MELKKLQFNWNKLGEIDPLWAILSFPDKEGNKWNIRDFFATGEQEINDVIATVKSFGIKALKLHYKDLLILAVVLAD